MVKPASPGAKSQRTAALGRAARLWGKTAAVRFVGACDPRPRSKAGPTCNAHCRNCAKPAPVCTVGKMVPMPMIGDAFLVLGTGTTWDEAFAAAEPKARGLGAAHG